MARVYGSRSEPTVDAGDGSGWILVAYLSGMATLSFNFGSVWSWWAAVWAPVFAIAVVIAIREWRLLAANGWRMPVLEWCMLVLAHVCCTAVLANILGLAK